MASIAVWYFEPIHGLQASSPGVFEVVQCAVNGQERRVCRSTRKDAQLYTVSLGEDYRAGEEITVAYTYRVLVQQSGHLLYLEVTRPAKGIDVQLWYGDMDIRYVNALDFIASAEQPRVLRGPASLSASSIEVGFDGWVFPRSGVAFVWVLEHELVAPAAATASKTGSHREQTA